LHGVTGRPLPGRRSPSQPRATRLDDLRRAEELGLDFAVLGPVAATPSHPDATPLGWARFAELRETVGLPIYALGGLCLDEVATARRHGAQGIAAMRGLWSN
jgi:8-oxo-dGTP diphosphatase